MSLIKFTETRLKSRGKKGVLTPDEHGYYRLCIGGLNAFNSVGEYYVYEGAKHLFESSSSFMRRVKTGCLKGELGHPKKLPGMSMEDYIQRIMSIEETNVCAHFADIELDPTYGRMNPEYRNPNLIAIIGRVKPAGPHAKVLADALANPEEDVCFSIRALTRDEFRNGRNERTLVQIICWDYVTEPGIDIARKYATPGLEGKPILESCQEEILTIGQLERLAQSAHSNLAIESSQLIKEVLEHQRTYRIETFSARPIYERWE